MKSFTTFKEFWENVDDREERKNVVGRGEGNLTLISEMGSHNCGGRKYLVSLKESNNSMD